MQEFRPKKKTPMECRGPKKQAKQTEGSWRTKGKSPICKTKERPWCSAKEQQLQFKSLPSQSSQFRTNSETK